LQAQAATEKIVVDGNLGELVWQQADFSDRRFFVQSFPSNGQPSSQETEVMVVYNEFAIYIGARLFDQAPDSINTELGLRDEMGKNVDVFEVGFDTYLNRQNAFVFIVTAAGVQADVYVTPSNEDINWNAVWTSGVQITDFGWSVEMEIPYSALRFPKKEVQNWGLNFGRIVQRKQEQTFWHPIDPNVNGVVNQFGTLTGLENIKPPIRLQLMPYLTGYLLKEGTDPWGTSLTGGMDLKYGLNQSFTLDMSLIPDFGQVRSDNVILNLGPFEVFFEENRAFFTEGTELFNSRGNLFYTRRVGSVYGLDPELEENEVMESHHPATAPLLNATKISGRTQGGLGLGFFNAVTNRSLGLATDTLTGTERDVVLDPMSNYNVIVADQNLKNNSNISLMNTNVVRSDGGRNANVTGATYSFFDQTNTWNVRGFAGLSQIWEKSESQAEGKADFGHAYSITMGKVSGNWRFELERQVETHDYEINDVGFNRSNNEISHGAEIGYRKNEPFAWFNSAGVSFDIEHTKTFEPREFNDMDMGFDANVQWKNFWSTGIGIGGDPVQQQNHFEPRTPGFIFRKDPSYRVWIFNSTDSRKRFQMRFNTGVWRRPNWDQTDNWINLDPRFRVNNKLTLNYSLSWMLRRREVGYVFRERVNDDWQITMGRRDVLNITNLFSMSYTFNEMMGLNLRVRHYWSKVNYTQFFNLTRDGYLESTAYDGLGKDGLGEQDANFNAFNVDLVYNWQFAPGSFLSLVWKNSIYTFDNDTSPAFWQNLQGTWNSPQQNSLSLRVIYFLDYFNVSQHLKG
jgi:hypothetical protein